MSIIEHYIHYLGFVCLFIRHIYLQSRRARGYLHSYVWHELSTKSVQPIMVTVSNFSLSGL